MTTITIFDQNYDFCPKLRFLTKIMIFDKNYDFWQKLRFLTSITIFDQNYDFLAWLRFKKSTSVHNAFQKNRYFYQKFLKHVFYKRSKFKIKNSINILVNLSVGIFLQKSLIGALRLQNDFFKLHVALRNIFSNKKVLCNLYGSY